MTIIVNNKLIPFTKRLTPFKHKRAKKKKPSVSEYENRTGPKTTDSETNQTAPFDDNHK